MFGADDWIDMANNQLYLVDRKNKTHILFAKSFGRGWFQFSSYGDVDEFIGDPFCDQAVAWGNTGNGPSNLCLMTEPEFIEWKKSNEDQAP